MKVRVCVRLAARPEQPLPLSAAHVSHVLCEVRYALLVLQLGGGAREDLQVGLEAAGGGRVGEDDVAEAVGEGFSNGCGVAWEGGGGCS